MPSKEERLQTLLNGGAYTAIITPFKKKGDTTGGVDLVRLREQIERQIEGGISGIVVTGTTGESPTLLHGVHGDVITFAIRFVNGRVPVIAGTGSNSTEEAIGLTRHAQLAGADAVLSVTPYYNKPSQEGLYAHYREIASEVPEMPIILYDIPGRCGVSIDVPTVVRLARDCPNIIIGIKEASGNLDRITYLRRALGEQFLIFCGNDDLNLRALRHGANGVISVLSNLVPRAVVELVQSFRMGDLARPEALQDRYAHLVELLFKDGNPSGIKCAMELCGLDSGALRLPLVSVGNETRAKLKRDWLH